MARTFRVFSGGEFTKNVKIISEVTPYFAILSQPFLEREDMFKSDGLTWKVRMEAVAKALHWRTMYFNPGA